MIMGPGPSPGCRSHPIYNLEKSLWIFCFSHALSACMGLGPLCNLKKSRVLYYWLKLNIYKEVFDVLVVVRGCDSQIL